MNEHTDEMSERGSNLKNRYQLCDEVVSELIETQAKKADALRRAKAFAVERGHNVSAFDTCARWGATETYTFTPQGALRMSPKPHRRERNS